VVRVDGGDEENVVVASQKVRGGVTHGPHAVGAFVDREREAAAAHDGLDADAGR
jgi:hypothetical protein